MSTSRITLPIAGMSCAACQSYLQTTLAGVPGVTAATVSLLANQATIEGTASLATLMEAVREAGYQASAPSQSLPEENESNLLVRAVLALAAALIAMVCSMPLMMRSGTTGTTGTPDPLLAAADRLIAPLMPAAIMSLPAQPMRWFLLVLTAAVMLFASPETYRRALAAMRHRTTNMSTLVALGTLAAFAYSVVATVAPSFFTRRGLAPDIYFEAVDFILAFLLLGALLDARARTRTQSALTGFATLQPATARVLRDGGETEVPTINLLPGDTIQLRPGERFPVDGIVLTGRSAVDESLLTGESQPVLKQPGATVTGGTINLDGPLTVRATTLGQGSVLAQMHRLLAEAQASRAPMQQLADRASAVFVPAILGLALLTFALWLGIGHSLPRAFSVAVAVLVIACPCAMGLAVPAALTVGIGRAAQLGFLVKSGEALERLARTDVVAFDKTGTLTEGHPAIVDVTQAPHTSLRELLGLAAALEQHSEHPLAKAVLSYAPDLPRPLLAEVKVHPGKGITAVHEGTAAAIGNQALLDMLHVVPMKTDRSAPTGQRSGAGQPDTEDSKQSAMSAKPAKSNERDDTGSRLYLVTGESHLLTLLASDALRGSAPEAIQQLARAGVEAHMLTGDHAGIAEAIAAQCGIASSNLYAGLLPEDKLAVIRQLQGKGKVVAMAGDGLNDAAALAQADTGIAVSTGTDLTREAADIVLMAGIRGGEIDLRAIPAAIRLARRTVRTMRQNLGWAIAYNALGLPVAAGLLYPHFHILLSPVLASAAMALSSTSVLANSLRLRNFR